jgi:hypothetical protein
LKNVTIWTFLCFKRDITGKTRTNDENRIQVSSIDINKGTRKRITEASLILQYKGKPGQTFLVICSWAEPAYCKLHILIIPILCSMTHTTFVDMTEELQSSSNILLKMAGPEFVTRMQQFGNTLRVVKMPTFIVLTLEYLTSIAEVNNESHLFT